VGVLVAAIVEWEKDGGGQQHFIPGMLSSRWILSACMPGIAALLCSSRQPFMLTGMTLLKVLLSGDVKRPRRNQFLFDGFLGMKRNSRYPDGVSFSLFRSTIMATCIKFAQMISES
jgi:hypothetical protein